MKKKQAKHRKLRKCEMGIKTKSKNIGCRRKLGFDGEIYSLNQLMPF